MLKYTMSEFIKYLKNTITLHCVTKETKTASQIVNI